MSLLICNYECSITCSLIRETPFKYALSLSLALHHQKKESSIIVQAHAFGSFKLATHLHINVERVEVRNG